MKKHNHKKLKIQNRIIVVLVGVVALGTYITYLQARTIQSNDEQLKEKTAQEFAAKMVAHEANERLEIEKARAEVIYTAKYGTVAEKIAILGLSDDEAELIRRESSFNHLAKSSKSTAFGLWQGLSSTRNKYGKLVGVNPNTDNPMEQIKMFRKYVSDRYGNIENALIHHDQKGFY